MTSSVKRIFVEKKCSYAVEAAALFDDIKTNLGIGELKQVRIINRYDMEGIDNETYDKAVWTVFAEPPVDMIYHEELSVGKTESCFAVSYLPGQFDQRADSAMQCLQIIAQKDNIEIKTAKIYLLSGVNNEQLGAIKKYLINPVDSCEAALEKPQTLAMEVISPPPVVILKGFIKMDDDELRRMAGEMSLAMSAEDLCFCRDYFKNEELRDPSITELRVIDTYWSDHCRHTTFHTQITDIKIDEGTMNNALRQSLNLYLETRQDLYGDKQRDINLMDIATVAAKKLKKDGYLDDLDISEEINACSIKADIKIDGKSEPWLIMFKNETHNHPTEIEPFGGAATCLGGAIRDPLSGRSYVYQAMRVTGSGDPRTPVTKTLPGKLPQRKITKEAARGYSSYGNQIGLATGQVAEVYDEGFVAKRMEVGAVIAAAPEKNVIREIPLPGDLVVLLGGRTGRDGCGGATGSSKEHDEKSLASCGAEVQKGNAPTERKLQRLFRNPNVSTLIKRCNDFGAGGVSVAIGELSDGIKINLDAVPKKYAGLDGTELAISESQERMAVVVAAADADKIIRFAAEENLEAVIIAEITANCRMSMTWRGDTIVNISREFLNTNGVKQATDVAVALPDAEKNFFSYDVDAENKPLYESWMENLSALNVASQKGLAENFDSTIGAGTVLMPFGGKHQLTPALGMAAKLPVLSGETKNATLMAYGYTPPLAKWSPYHGAMYAVIDSVAKITAMGGNPQKVRLSLQEYFEKLGKDSYRWGKPFAALLGAFEAQMRLKAPAIGGKDSMSGSFNSLDVPPTLISFAVGMVEDAEKIISPEFKRTGSHVIFIPLTCDINEIPNWADLKSSYNIIHGLINEGLVLAAQTVGMGGIAAAISKMCFGNKMGFKFADKWEEDLLYAPEIGAVILELDSAAQMDTIEELFAENYLEFNYLGKTAKATAIGINGITIPLEDCLKSWTTPLESTFPTKPAVESSNAVPTLNYTEPAVKRIAAVKTAQPRVFIPIFPGTNCEYDTARAFEKAGGMVRSMVFRNLTPDNIKDSVAEMVKQIRAAQIIMIPGGFSAGDEPDGSGKFIAAVFRNQYIKEAVHEHLQLRDGLMLGICNGFQALIKLGLVPYGEIRDLDADSPTLTFNSLGRHISCIAGTRVVSSLSPWFSECDREAVYNIAVSHGEGRFTASDAVIESLIEKGQVATQYVDMKGKPSMDIAYNPNGSSFAIEGITSPDGRVLGKMGHSERSGANTFTNIPGEKVQPIFTGGIKYFK